MRYNLGSYRVQVCDSPHWFLHVSGVHPLHTCGCRSKWAGQHQKGVSLWTAWVNVKNLRSMQPFCWLNSIDWPKWPFSLQSVGRCWTILPIAAFVTAVTPSAGPGGQGVQRQVWVVCAPSLTTVLNLHFYCRESQDGTEGSCGAPDDHGCDFLKCSSFQQECNQNGFYFSNF